MGDTFAQPYDDAEAAQSLMGCSSIPNDRMETNRCTDANCCSRRCRRGFGRLRRPQCGRLGQQRQHRFKPGPAVLAGYTSMADQRARLRNIGICRRAIRTRLREHLVTNYLPKQCYNRGVLPGLSEWPAQLRWWDSVPGGVAWPTHARWLKHYLPLVDDGGTWAWLEIGQSDLFSEPLPRNVVASAFANRELHLVLANYGATGGSHHGQHIPCGRRCGRYRYPLASDPRSLCILRRRGEVS